MKQDADAIVIGAGVAGLRCALGLQEQGLKPMLLEANSRVGGRIRTDSLEGFQLDRGFQVLLTAYDECQSILDYDSLELGVFEPGALVWTGSKFEKLIDPWRRPKQLIQSALSPIGSIGDKLKVGGLKEKLKRKSVESIYEGNDTSTLDHLQEVGFSADFIESFFRPFYGGIFLENELSTSSRMFEFVFKMFGQGYAALPQEGMEAIPKQLCGRLEPDVVQLSAPVQKIGPDYVLSKSGDRYEAPHIVLATDMKTAEALTGGVIPDRGWHATQCSYFAAPRSPLPDPIIALNGSGSGSITNIAVPSDVTSGYSQNGESLICVSTSVPVSKGILIEELNVWFGNITKDFRHLADYRIPQALPRQSPGDNPYGKAPLRDKAGRWMCGDYRFSSSIQGAMASGRIVAEAISERFSGAGKAQQTT